MWHDPSKGKKNSEINVKEILEEKKCLTYLGKIGKCRNIKGDKKKRKSIEGPRNKFPRKWV